MPVTPPVTPTRPSHRVRRNLQLDFGEVQSPDYNASPVSLNADEEQFNNLLENAQLHFDPEGLVDELGNADIILEPMEEFNEQQIVYDEVPAVPIEQEIIYDEVPAVPIENDPEIDFDETIRINFSISFFNEAFIEEGEDALDAALDQISNGPASPPDVNAYVQMEE